MPKILMEKIEVDEKKISRMALAFEHALHELKVSGKTERETRRRMQLAHEVAHALHETESYHRYVEFVSKGSCEALADGSTMFEVICTAVNYGVEVGLTASRMLAPEKTEEVLQ